ncbi:MAG: ParM/StbA family protein [Paenibacillus macerans]|uniref:ParM/StbA family protein n=1 Tax=Paenibacillus macerans TaxID=44252 RepID=UPI0024315903|nr:ParM/StbA family protein [Paenibacillus macerans]MBS5913108.1 ParM/StbA family protein [Paenibacillus macerans]
MHNQFLIAVDSGKSTTKAAMKEEAIHKIKFQTKVEEIVDNGAEITPGSYSVEFEGKSYLVGNMLDESKMDFNLSKKSNAHRICIYLAIAELLQNSKRSAVLSKIVLAVNIPISLYKNEKLKTEFGEYIRNNGETINIVVNNKPFLYRIENLYLLPEGVGPVYSNLNLYRQKRVLIFDIGSLNVNIQEFNNLIPVYDRMLTADLGVNILRSKIADKLSTRYGVAISDADAEAIYRDKYLIINGEKMEESKKIVQQLMESHVKDIFNFARSRKISFANSEIVLVGGGSLLLKEQLIKECPTVAVTNEAQYSNVLSFLTILEAKHRGKS